MNSLRVDHPDIREFIEAKSKEQKKIEILMDNGIPGKEAIESVSYQNVNLSVRVTDEFMRAVEEDKIWQTVPVHNKELAEKMPKYKARDLLRLIAEGTWACGDPGTQYHDTINSWHTCPNTGPINASNPCSEYMHVDDSACNLASQNLRAFLNGDGSFNVDDFKRAVRVTAISQDLEIDNSSYPTLEIARNAHRLRPLGMGYANLGSLIMSMGLPYDSDESRAIAASITALMTGTVYETSAEMAEKLGAFGEYDKNKESMLQVMEKHRTALSGIQREKLPKGLEKVLDSAEEVWDNVIERGKKYGFRNAQASVLAPTGTIGFMMDCDTKGIEPEIGLVQRKLLAEGGILKIVNGTVEFALEKLGYDRQKIESIKRYVLENETIEGSELKEEHLPIFDCANKPKSRKRTISPMGHIKMMAAVQPFLSGAISKTVNMPNEATVENIEEIYMNAWKMGLKAVAIYRDESKRMQPLSFTKSKLEDKVGVPVRRKLPNTTDSKRHKFNIAGHEGYLHVGLYPDKTPGETFINMSKEGSTIGGLMDSIWALISIALQHGVPLKSLVNKFKDQKFEPYGIVLEGDTEGENGIRTATSIPDYIFRFLEKQFLNGNESQPAKDGKNNPDNGEGNKNDGEIIEERGKFCPTCGKQMIKKGHCEQRCDCGYIDLAGCGG